MGLDNILDLLFVEGLNSIDGREKIEILGYHDLLISEFSFQLKDLYWLEISPW